MQEVWVKPNRRILFSAMILPGLLIVTGLFIAIAAQIGGHGWVAAGAAVVAVAGIVVFLSLVRQLRIPRIGYERGKLKLYLAARGALAVPISNVECFFFGESAAQLPAWLAEKAAVRNLVIRVAEKAAEYHNRDVLPRFGRWEAGYITINGAWCEPLSLELVRILNDRLAAAQKMSIQPEERDKIAAS